ncbi:MAG: hypothetical protein SGJ16_11900 [Nitrospirota bacterium]|nr:hypothetical protein [Nitrospirota bacterium]
MSGKPHRHKILEQFLKPKQKELSEEEWDALLAASKEGLVWRLRRAAPEEARAFAAALPLAKLMFTIFSESEGLVKAKAIATYILAEYSLAKINTVTDITAKHPVALLIRYKEFLDGLPPCRRLDERKEWLRRYEFPEYLITQWIRGSDADLAECVLARHLGMSQSKFHKRIASARAHLTS